MRMHGKFKNLIFLIISMLIITYVAGCGNKQPEINENAVQIYYVNKSETGIVAQEYELTADKANTVDALAEMVEQLGTIPQKLEYEAPLSGKVSLIEYTYNEGLITFNFNKAYSELKVTTEILIRAAIVRTVTQLPDVTGVSFLVDGVALTDSKGSVIGTMTADTFIYNAGNEINTYEKVELMLYFATEEGTALQPVYREVVYNSNISMERLAVEQLLKGPNTNIAFATLNPEAKLNSITVRDGVCYADFDSAFLVQPNTVSSEVAIYSLVNTLVNITEVNKVQISVDGETDVTFMENINLNTMFERNLDIVQ
ncbi:MAG: GerMN domain-containing protein [Butyrivibrio sp.]|nr:GerMN domain-containing protein [Butyrivibrio sp.]